MESLKRDREESDTENPSQTSKKLKIDPSEYDTSGNTIYLTPLTFVENPPLHFLSIRQLLYEDLKGNMPRTLESVLLTTFCFEEEFIAPIISSGVKVCLISESPTPGIFRIMQNVTMVAPRKNEPWGKFHAKLFLLKFPEFLRVVISSANLVGYDWSNIGQVIWFQDFPYGDPTGTFYDELSSFLSVISGKYDFSKELGIDLSLYSFSTASVEIVASVPGRHRDISKYGQGRVRSLLKESNRSFKSFMFQCSSIGILDTNFLKDLKLSFANNRDANTEIVFPSFKSVESCHLGLGGGGTTFLKEEYYKRKNFPRDDLRDISSPEQFPMIRNHLTHSKVLISHDDGNIDKAVVYIGSHNLSASAWGRFQQNGLFISNYELGVVFMKQSPQQLNNIVKRLPFGFPPPRYPEDTEPWFINKYLD